MKRLEQFWRYTGMAGLILIVGGALIGIWLNGQIGAQLTATGVVAMVVSFAAFLVWHRRSK